MSPGAPRDHRSATDTSFFFGGRLLPIHFSFTESAVLDKVEPVERSTRQWLGSTVELDRHRSRVRLRCPVAATMHRRIFLGALLALLLSNGCSAPNTGGLRQTPEPSIVWNPGKWTLAWQDEFEGSAGQAPDPGYWTHQVGGNGWGNQELQYYTDSI